MTSLKKDIWVGGLFFVGVFGFMSGEFIISTVLFATATVFSTLEENLNIGGR
ncbi:hypothetical protein Q9L42_014890 [Methylomarinum sp. Ch1-1]|uniref:Uncharacterized protein n=1 Tax=Methylomarinum roseum TaxID=3067653 RepID=A0AAU7NRM9_9GAMM|nr:hypothetical protein [Methylomarinum sp. Ch1-1]MDP4520388.1 hypothetical protein [Methylomarinum sp. Ch1-1]